MAYHLKGPALLRGVHRIRSQRAYRLYSEFTHAERTLAITCRGATCGTLNMVPPCSYITGNAMALDELDRERVILEYLHHSLVYRGLADVISGSAQPQITRQGLVPVLLPLPPLPEQRKIAAILSSVDDAIEATQAVIGQLQVVKKAMMAELLTRGLPGRHTRFKQTEIGEVPEEWEVLRIVDVADVDYGISAAVSKNTDPSLGWPIITGANLALDGSLDVSDVVYHPPPKSPQHLLRPGDLLLNWRSGSSAHVGKTAIFDREGQFTYASFVLRIRCRGRFVPRFGHALLNFMRGQGCFSRDLSQQVNFKMNAAVFRDVLIRLPGIAEQELIGEACTTVDAALAENRASQVQLGATKSALMSVLLTGDLRVTPDDPA